MNLLKGYAAFGVTFLGVVVPLWMLLKYPSLVGAFFVLGAMCALAAVSALSVVHYSEQARKERATQNYWKDRCRVCYTVRGNLVHGECVDCRH